MVSKKAKSKRVTTRMREKIRKKVREHHRKQRKEARKDVLSTGTTKRAKKDLGIPNLYPYKKALLLKAKKDTEKSKQKDDGLKVQNIFKGLSFDDLAISASKNDELKVCEDKITELRGWRISEPISDASVNAYYKEFRKVVDSSDVILEVLDCRDPLGCRPRNIERMIIESSANKRIILVLNKIDLVPKEAVTQWLKYLRNELPVIAFRSCTQGSRTSSSGHRRADISVESAPQKLLKSGECIGADNLMNLLKNFCRNNNVKTSIVVGVIGYPNVGKSSIINSLKRFKVCNVGSEPGITKSMQMIRLDKNIKLLDCPGLVFGKGPLISQKVDNTDQPLLKNYAKKSKKTDLTSDAIEIILRCDKQQLSRVYNLNSFLNPNDFLILLAIHRGRIKKGGIPDTKSAAGILVSDWNSGKIPFYTLPSKALMDTKGPCYLSTEIVSTWSKEFDINNISNTENYSIVEYTESDKQTKTAKLILAKSSQLSESHPIYNTLNDNEELLKDSNAENITSVITNQPNELEVKIAPNKLPSNKKIRFNLRNVDKPFTSEESALNPIKPKRTRSLKPLPIKRVKKTDKELAMTIISDDKYNFEEHFSKISLPSTIVNND